MGVYIPYTRLPSEYQEVEYIQSSGTQWIDSGYIPKSTSELEVKFQNVSNINTYRTILGTRYSTTANAFWIGYANNDSYYEFSPTNTHLNNSSLGWDSIGVDYTIEFKNKNLINNGTTVATSVNFTQNANYTLYLFAGHAYNQSNPFEPSASKIYYCKLREGGTLVRNLIPCYRKSDSVIGMYDLVNSVFYTNAGSGTFSKGNDVTMVEMKNAYIGKYVLNFATQGPSPDGFHVPLKDEWTNVYNIRKALGGGSSDGTNFGKFLKLPFAGYREYSSASISGRGSRGEYLTSMRYDGNNARKFTFDASTFYTGSYDFRSYGFSIRCFKNIPTIPTSSWTKLYGTSIEAGGIFWSSTDGLISLSSDGNIWITIADKNLGATTVWNSGDTLSEANCGYYYQRGNNYGFPFTGSVTTSSTQVDASTYGPGNYYSSNKFIIRNSSPYRWDTTDNANLWGGVDGNVPID